MSGAYMINPIFLLNLLIYGFVFISVYGLKGTNYQYFGNSLPLKQFVTDNILKLFFFFLFREHKT